MRKVILYMTFTFAFNETETKEVCVMYQIKYVFGHYNVYAPSGRFLFSADTESEAWEELEQMED